MKTFVLVLSLSALAFAGCASRTTPRPAETAPTAVATPSSQPAKVKVLKDLAGSSWVLVQLDGAAVEPAGEGWAPQSLVFEPEGLRVWGNAGVNGFGASYDQYDNELRLGRLALTRRLGPAHLMAAEQRYTHVLSRVVGWRQEGAQLVLITVDNQRAAVFDRVPAKKR